MLVLRFALGRERSVAASAEEVRLLASEVLRRAGRQREVGVLGFIDEGEGALGAMWPRRQLRLAVNLDTGFAGLIWYEIRGSGWGRSHFEVRVG